MRVAERAAYVLAGVVCLTRFGVCWGQVATGKSASSGTAVLFEKQCYSCHNIGGGDKKGPDLVNVTQRRQRAWLRRFVSSPQALKRTGDATTVQLFSKYAPEVMPDQVLSTDQIDQLLDWIEQLSKRKQTFVTQTGRLYRRPRPADIPIGRRLFTGGAKLSKAGPACISCHAVAGTGAFGGGTLGPDLTNANMKYAEVELASILKAPAFPTMSKLFANRELSDEEVVQLFAFLQSVRTRAPDVARGGSNYVAWSVVGALALFGLMSFAWRGRLRGVRKGLVAAEARSPQR